MASFLRVSGLVCAQVAVRAPRCKFLSGNRPWKAILVRVASSVLIIHYRVPRRRRGIVVPTIATYWQLALRGTPTCIERPRCPGFIASPIRTGALIDYTTLPVVTLLTSIENAVPTRWHGNPAIECACLSGPVHTRGVRLGESRRKAIGDGTARRFAVSTVVLITLLIDLIVRGRVIRLFLQRLWYAIAAPLRHWCTHALYSRGFSALPLHNYRFYA
ncbi:hypothetical protein COU80_05860 [Candidatus Peregrinibacteria bacterium CG10_big_fil_rev_8_21_14_0_10_55_24]|nr:MAG: hypothetical protein COU80_05860 [Candidatus Peregrinibacteria bacterium CG10_big_fil_rev_8_21_14_0_10_55_24]